jgi:hypothetical protein
VENLLLLVFLLLNTLLLPVVDQVAVLTQVAAEVVAAI